MIFLSETTIIDRHKAVIELLFSSGAGTLNLYSGDLPATPTTTPTGLLVATSYTSLAYAPTVLTPSTEIEFVDSVVAEDATPTFARLCTGNGTPILDVVVGGLSSSAPIKYNIAEFYQGGILKVTSLILREE